MGNNKTYKEALSMTEKEKMLKGLIYDSNDEELVRLRVKAHKLCKEYNDTIESDVELRESILDKLLPNHKKGIYLQSPIQFDYGENISIGENSYANFNFVVLDCSPVSIGDNVFIGPNVSLLCPIHPLRYQERNLKFDENKKRMIGEEYSKPITIEDNCWICGNVTICGGVSIGEGSVIGAGSVVTKDIPPHSLAFGNPCKVKRQITEEDALSHHHELFEK